MHDEDTRNILTLAAKKVRNDFAETCSNLAPKDLADHALNSAEFLVPDSTETADIPFESPGLEDAKSADRGSPASEEAWRTPMD